MTEMIERVEDAITSKSQGHIYEDGQIREMARAAIEAMLVPTDQMLGVGCGYTDFVLPETVIGNRVADHKREMYIAWRSMIDEALKT